MRNLASDTDNLGGLISVYAVPPTSFVRLRHDYSDGMDTAEFRRVDDIVQIPVLPDSDFQFSEELEESEAGIAYLISVEGVIPKICKVNQQVIDDLERGEWYVLAVDQNGEAHWCGHEDALMHFSTSKVTGNASAARNHIVFTFECLQSVRSSIVTNLTF